MNTLLTGLAIGESPRWHDSRLWFAHWGTQEIVAVDLHGNAQVMARVPSAGTFSIDWLPDGTLLVVQAAEPKLLRRTPDGTFAVHCDLSPLSDRTWNEITVDGRGNVYLNSLCFRFGQEEFRRGIVALLNPDGTLRQVADGIAFPKGMVVTPDNSKLIVAESFAGKLTAFDIQPDGSLANRRTWADFGGPGCAGDGICMDADGAIWCTGVQDTRRLCMRVREGGEVLEQFETELFGFACMLGGDDGKTLFICEADWRGRDTMDSVIAERGGRITTLRAPSPHAGYP
jgi:sugar lactone lactonase YvrE